MASTIKIKRSGVAGKQPNTSTLSVGELAINYKDKKLFSSNGTAVFEIGASGGGGGANAVVTRVKASDLNVNSFVVTSVTGTYVNPNNFVSFNTKTFDSLKGSDTVVTGFQYLASTSYLQVANATATYTTKAYAASNSYVKSTLANTNSYIATKASWSALTGTNTAVRTLISDRLQVANASSTYATKASPTTSGVLAHTGRATISTNLTVTGNTTVSTHIITPNRHGFRVYGSGTTNNLTTTQNSTGKLNNNNFAVDYNQGSVLHANTGVFTARVGGLYQICMNVRNSGYASGISQLICYKNKGVAGEAVMVMIEFAASSSMNHAGGSTVASLASGDTLGIYVAAGQVNFDGNDNWSVTHLG